MRRPTSSPIRAALLLVCALAMSPMPVSGEIAIIVSRDSPITTLSKSQIADLYLGRLHSVEEGSRIRLLDHPKSSALRERFFQQLLGMSITRVNSYWARLQFSGDTQPPQALANDDQILAAVARHPNTIGYVDAAHAGPEVRTLLVVPE